MLRSRTGLELSPPPSNCFGNSRDVTVGEFMEATEAFCTGTAAEIVPIARLATGEGEEAFERVFPHGADLPGGPVTSKLLEMLRQAMAGKHVLNGADSNGSWIRNPFSPEDDFCEY
jgi:hypothetical protein